MPGQNRHRIYRCAFRAVGIARRNSLRPRAPTGTEICSGRRVACGLIRSQPALHYELEQVSKLPPKLEKRLAVTRVHSSRSRGIRAY
jgi:hypothetical protein